jgi:hypothetical protein
MEGAGPSPSTPPNRLLKGKEQEEENIQLNQIILTSVDIFL